MSKEESGNQAPDRPDVSESELRDMKVDELRGRAKEEGIGGTSSMRKDELVGAISGQQGEGSGAGEGEAGQPGDAGPDAGRMRTGASTSKSLQYSQEVTSPDEEPERAGRSLVTTSHEVIRQWAEERGGTPAAVEGTEHGDTLGVLRFDFGGGSERLRHVSWDEWFETFDKRRLNFVYQEQRKDGKQSNFFRLESPDREDA
jgi:Rho termination factor, N-terminal domain